MEDKESRFGKAKMWSGREEMVVWRQSVRSKHYRIDT